MVRECHLIVLHWLELESGEAVFDTTTRQMCVANGLHGAAAQATMRDGFLKIFGQYFSRH